MCLFNFSRLARQWRIRRAPRVATIATMPTRAQTFALVVKRILPQVDMLFVYLDGFNEAPEVLRGSRKVTIARSQDYGALHASGRFLVLPTLKTPSVVAVVDDDIKYPRNYVSRLARRLAAFDGRAVVGVHGGIFRPPYLSSVTDAERFHFRAALERDTLVDELGAGACAFLSDVLDFDVREWDGYDGGDLRVAMEAKNRGLPLICVARRRKWLRPYEENQPDSLWLKTKADPSARSALMREHMREAVVRYEAQAAGAP